MDKQSKIRIQRALKDKYPYLSQKQIKKFLADNRVRINGHVAKTHTWVVGADDISISDKYLIQKLAPNEKVDCQLIKKTRDFIVFNKGPFVHSVAHDFDETETAANWLLILDSKLDQVSSSLESGLIHRLDYETSGLMIAARNKDSFDSLKAQFTKHVVYKEYVCFVSDPPPNNGEFSAYVGKKVGSSKRIRIQKNQSQQKRLSKIHTEILSSKKIGRQRYKLHIRLISGYRHQIRAHLALLGCSIVGDKLYGGIGAKRLMLHAMKFQFLDRNGKKIIIESKLNQEFET